MTICWEKLGKKPLCGSNEAVPADRDPRSDLLRFAANPRRFLPSILVPAPARACLRYEPEIALRDPHSLAVCGHYL
jgi:hypothetical protein